MTVERPHSGLPSQNARPKSKGVSKPHRRPAGWFFMPTTDETEVGRKRRAHTKSRRGCGNCKLRRVKCDETRPECNKCRSYGVACNYGGESSNELQHSGEAAFIIEQPAPKPSASSNGSAGANGQLPPTPPQEIILSMMNYPLALHDTDEVYRLTETDINTLQRFYDRTVLTIGTAQTVNVYRDSIMQLAFGHSYLTHVVLTMVLMHDRYLSEDPWQQPSTEETFHHYHGTAMFNKMLCGPLEHHEKDAMWGCAALLGAITIAAVEATTPEESWPLKQDGPNDLDWLRMSDGKKEVWRLSNPMREDSIWMPAMSHHYDQDPTPKVLRPELDFLMPHFVRLYNYDDNAPNDSGDAYHTAASIVIRLVHIQCTHSTILYFLSFIGHMEPRFRTLLHQKDEKAMLLLAWWYAKMIDYPAWWLQRRAVLEAKAICIYLGRRYMHFTDVGRLLDFPKMMCGFAVSSEFEKQVDKARSGGQTVRQ